MRTQEAMMACIDEFICKNQDISLAYLNGSRANPNAPRDKYQDYDLVLVVDRLEKYLESNDFLTDFGAIAMLQEPNIHVKKEATETYNWLVLFTDHNRIDLTVETLDYFKTKTQDSMTRTLYDPHALLVGMQSDVDYWVQKPSEHVFQSTVNDFWWCLNNVGKGLARHEMPYVMSMFLCVCKKQLDTVIDWHIGATHQFKVNPGKYGKWYQAFLGQDAYTDYLKIYSSTEGDALWQAIYQAMDCMHHHATQVAECFGYTYRHDEEAAIRNYLDWIQKDSCFQ